MNKAILYSLLALVLATGNLSAQQQNNTAEKCASAILHNQLMKNDAEYRARFLANEAKIQQIIARQQAQKSGGPNQTQATVYTIPVVVHVIHLGESVGSGTNISDAQIQSAIDNLTDAYRNQSPYTGVDIEVEFALAQRDPNCSATTGINRVNGTSVSGYSTSGLTTGTGGNETTIKALSKWDNTTYYNIWIVAGIDGNMGGGGVQGFAYFPGASSAYDGAVILYNSFGYDPTGSLGYNLKSYTNRNVTTIHELGHAFNLYHTFEGDDANDDGTADQCPASSGCGSGAGDCVSDTPPHQRSSSNCNTSGTNSCDGGSSNSLFVHNFMDYSSDACQTQFTSGQKTRMRAALEASRGSLLNSMATTAPSGSLPPSACVPVEQNVGSYPIGVYGFTFNTINVTSGSANADGGYVDRTCYHQTIVTAGSAVTVTVNTGTSYNHDVRIYIDYNNDGDFSDAGETVFSSDNVMTTHSGTINISSSPGVTGQVVRMRVFADYFSGTISSACYNPLYGQAEDFGLIINPAAGSPPVANFSGSPTTLCAGSSVSFSDLSTNSPTSWSWTFQGGTPATSTSQNPTVTYSAAGTYSVSLTATNGSGSDNETKTAYITVNAIPSVTGAASANPVCSGSQTTLSGSGATSYSWSGGVSNGVAFTPSSTTTYTVTGTTSGCSDNAVVTVTVTSTPTVGVSGTMTITSGNSTTLTATGATSYSWAPGTGLSATSGANVTASPTTTTAYTLTGTTSGCSDTQTFTVTVNPAGSPPVANFSGSPTTICAGSPVAFTDLSTNSPTSWSWSFQGGTPSSSTSQNPTVTYASAGTYSVTLTATNSNGSDVETKTAYITVNATPTVGVSGTMTITSGSSTTLTATGGTTYAWSPGTGLSATTGSSVVANPTSTTAYTVTGTTSGCSDEQTFTITVNAPLGPTNLLPAYCGITETSLTQVLYCAAVSGATNYRYELTDLSNNSVYTYLRGNNYTSFQMSWVNGVGYSKTYSVRVAAYVSGAWTSYGSACNVTTPAPPTTQLDASSCGITETSLSQVLGCLSVVGASNYRYELTDQSNSVIVYVRGGSQTTFQMNWVTGVKYGQTYSIRVAAYVGGVWLAYGTACNVTTPSTAGTQLAAGSCGITETSLSQVLYCTAVSGATNYRYELTDQSSNVTVYTRGGSQTTFQMNWVSTVQYNQTYSIRVAAYVGGTWLAYGTACSVTTPAAPTTQLMPAYCNIVESSTSEVLYCTSVTGATNYRYELTDQTNSAVLLYTRGTSSNNFLMSWVSGIQFSRAYSVRVAAYVGGTWLAYGSACMVTTGATLVHNPGDGVILDGEAAQSRSILAGTESLQAQLFPNPSDGHVFLQVNRYSELVVTNVLGEIIYEGALQEGVNEVYFLSAKPGMYIMHVRNGSESVQMRMIKE
jgi:PKD repeat protein